MARIGTFAPANPASPRQLSFLLTLRTELFDLSREILVNADEDPSPLDSKRDEIVTTDDAQDKRQASRKIDSLLNEILPTLRGTAAAGRPVAAPLDIGLYRKGGDIFKIVKSRGSDRRYAKRLTSDGFEYAAGAINRLSADDRMTREEAAEYGRETGQCCVCGAELTNPDSVAAGIGPICGSRF